MLYTILLFMSKRYLIGPDTKVDLYLSLEADVARFQSPSMQDVGFLSFDFGWVFDRFYMSGFGATWIRPNLTVRDTLLDREIPLNVFQIDLEMGIIPLSLFVFHPILYTQGGIGFTSDARDGIGYEDIYLHFTPSVSMEVNITPGLKMGIRWGYTYLLDFDPENTNIGTLQGNRWGAFFKISSY